MSEGAVHQAGLRGGICSFLQDRFRLAIVEQPDENTSDIGITGTQRVYSIDGSGRYLTHTRFTNEKSAFDPAGDEAPSRSRRPRALCQHQCLLARCAAS